MNKIFLVGITGLPACYGGFETLSEKLVEHLSDSFHFNVFCSSPHYKKKVVELNENYKRISLPLSANGISSIFYDGLSILIACFKANRGDILLLLGTSGAWAIPIIRPFIKARIIVNVDGIEWRRNKFNSLAKLALKILEGLAARNADLIICDNIVIDKYIQKKYKCDTNVIAYGGDPQSFERNIKPDAPRRYALSICRIEPENNVHLILESALRANINIVFVGNWDASTYGKRLIEEYGKFGKIKMLYPIYDSNKLYDLRSNCHLYIHGHSVGGSNPSLIEMMFYEKPIIAYNCMFNKCTLNNNGTFFRNIDDLVEKMEIFYSDHTNDMIKRSKNAKTYALQNYTWKRISNDYSRVFLKFK